LGCKAGVFSYEEIEGAKVTSPIWAVATAEAAAIVDEKPA